MPTPTFDARISFGNVLTILAMVAAVFLAWSDVRSDAAQMRERLDDHAKRLLVMEAEQRRDVAETTALKVGLAERLVALEVAVRTLTSTVQRIESMRTGAIPAPSSAPGLN